jgi:WD40 repeat protein
VYDFIEGVTLKEWSAFAQLSASDIATLLAKLASALNCAHGRGIVHRDLKPDNILIDLAGEPHLTDFGLARRLDDRVTQEGVTLGTVAYMSPEQALGVPGTADRRSDIFSLGVMFYELLTDELPFAAMTIPGYLAQLSATEAPSPRNKRPSTPRDLATICQKCLSRRPEERYDTAALLEDDLRRYLDGRPILARPVGVLERARRWALREPLIVALLGLLVLLSLLGPAVALHQLHLRRMLKRQHERMTVQSQRLERRTEQLRQIGYDADLQQAYRLMNEGKLIQSDARLDRQIPNSDVRDLRDFAWHFLRQRIDAAYHVVVRADQPLHDLALIDETRMATVGTSPELLIWDMSTARITHTVPLPSGDNFAVACDPQRERLLVGIRPDETSQVAVVDLKTFKPLKTLPIESKRTIESIRVFPTGTVAVGTRHEGITWFTSSDARRGMSENHDRHEALGLSPDGMQLFTLRFDNRSTLPRHVREVCVWDVEQGTRIDRVDLDGKPTAVAVSPDGKRLAVSEDRSVIRLFQLPVFQELNVRPIPARRDVRYLAFASDGEQLVAGCADGSIVLLREPRLPESMSPSIACDVHAARLFGLLPLSGNRFLTCSADGSAAILEIDKLSSGMAIVVAEQAGRDELILSLAASANDNNLVVIGNAAGTLADLQGRKLAQFDVGVTAVAVSPNDQFVACGLADGRIGIVSSDSWTILKTLVQQHGRGEMVRTLSFSADGSSLFSGGSDHVDRRWRLSDGQAMILGTATDFSSTCIELPSGEVAFGGRYEPIRIYDAKTGELLDELPASGVDELLLADVELISAHRDGGVRIWNSVSRERLAIMRGHESDVTTLALHPDGKTLATGGHDGTLRLWNLRQREEIGVAYRADRDCQIQTVRFTADGKSLLALVTERGVGARIIRWTPPFVPTGKSSPTQIVVVSRRETNSSRLTP